MPPINVYKCSQCQKVLHKGWGGHRYVEDDEGKRIVCPHPGEDYMIGNTLNIPEEDYRFYVTKFRHDPLLIRLIWGLSLKHHRLTHLVKKRTGYNSNCVCLDCLKMTYLDLGISEKARQSWRWYYGAKKQKDNRLCPHCGSTNVQSVIEMIGLTCPFCKEGQIVEKYTGTKC